MAEQYKVVYRTFYEKLVKSLPLTDARFRAALVSRQLFCGDLLEQVDLKGTNAEKCEHFLTNAINPSLNVGKTNLFVSLLQVMENFDSPTLRSLANEINVGLQIATDVSQIMLHTQSTNPMQPPIHTRGDPSSAQQRASDDRKRKQEIDAASKKIKLIDDTSTDPDSPQQGASGDKKTKEREDDPSEVDPPSTKRKQTTSDHRDVYAKKFKDDDVTSAFAYLFNQLGILFDEVDFVQLKRACIQRGTLLSGDVKQRIREANELDALLDALDNPLYCNWLNTRLLKRIVKTIDIPEAEQLIQTYENYVYSRKVSYVKKYFDSRFFDKSHVSLVKAKINAKKFESLTVADIIDYCQELEFNMRVDNGSITATQCQSGCLLITCAIPMHCTLHAYKTAKANFLNFRQFHIRYIEIESFPKVFALNFAKESNLDRSTSASDGSQLISHYYTCLENYMDADSVSHMMLCEHLITDDDYEAITAAPNDNKMNTLLLQYIRSINVSKLSGFYDILESIETHTFIGDFLSTSFQVSLQKMSTNVRHCDSKQSMAKAIEDMKVSEVNIIFNDLIDYLFLNLSATEKFSFDLIGDCNSPFTEQWCERIHGSKSLFLFKVHLSPFITWFDHSILKDLVVASSSKDAQQLLEQFDTRIDSYCKEPITSFPIPYPSQLMIPLVDSEYTILSMKVRTPSRGGATQGEIILQDVKEFKRLMKRKWEIRSHDIQLVAVHTKFELLYWMIPKRLVKVIESDLVYEWQSRIIMVAILPTNFQSLADNENEKLKGPFSSLNYLWEDDTEVVSSISLQYKLENVDTQNLAQQHIQLHGKIKMMKEENERNRIRINKLESDDMGGKLKRIPSLESKAEKKQTTMFKDAPKITGQKLGHMEQNKHSSELHIHQLLSIVPLIQEKWSLIATRLQFSSDNLDDIWQAAIDEQIPAESRNTFCCVNMLTIWYKTSDCCSVDAIIAAVNAPHVGMKAKIPSIEAALTSEYVPTGSGKGESVVHPPEKFEQPYFDMITRFCLELNKSQKTISDICEYLKVCNINSDVYEKITEFSELIKSFEHHQLLNKTDLSWLKNIACHAQCSKATDVIEEYETLLLADKIPWYSSHSRGTFLVGRTDKKPQNVTIKDSSNAKSTASKIVNLKESDSILNFSEVGSVVFYWKILDNSITIEIPKVADASLIKECKGANLTHVGIMTDGTLSLTHIDEMDVLIKDESPKSDFQDAPVNILPQSKEEKFTALLKQMNLHEKFPQKLSFKEAVTIRQETIGTIQQKTTETIHTTDKLPVLPYLILQKIMMCDQRCRSSLFKVPSSTTQSEPIDSQSETSDSDSDDVEDERLHPVDCMLAVLHCCDNILRQELFFKLSLCQLALPFLLPNPADNSVTFLLWAMRSLFRGWKCYKTGEKECRTVDYQGPIVSFLRIGTSQLSKSEILNAVIGGESNIFFYRRECEGGDCKRKFVDGLVEMCSYFPSGKKDDPFSDAVTFLNLRGDAQQHSKQIEFLQKISCVSVVLISDTGTNEFTVEMLKQFAKVPGGIILLCDEASDKETKRYARQLRQALPNSIKIKLKDKNMIRNKAALKKEVQENIAKKISQVITEKHLSISKCCQIARDANIDIDEDNEASKAGKQYAEMVMKNVKGQTKDKMLPLQGPSLWRKWAKHDKERHRHKMKERNVTDYNAQHDDEKRKVRVEQLHYCKNLTSVMDCFLEHLLERNITIRKYFLLWLKIFLDDHSRNILPKLHAEYQETRDQLYALKHGNLSEDNSKITELTERLKIQNQELILASFGLEHLFREMGQIYEACIDFSGCTVSKELQKKVECFPEIMADMIEEGLCALEIMDGDTSHVPSLWILAVIDKLKAVCSKNAREKNGGKIFVLSVLGIQSSGKSTLLNTLFGLRFNVSAGRRTRGAYMQLLTLNNSLRQQIDCDYILVVDTEGLRAPELQLEGLMHDNELAAFVIGLADATIINIYGESPGDLDDILQTSLHAFIRMRNVEMSPSCMFVHQNVPDVLASSKNKMGRQKFHIKLDNMTQAAAKVENCDKQYDSFNQLIDFDDQKHVFYFSGLWKGDPPMASVNTGYSENALILKTALIEITHDKKSRRCALETFKLRIQQIWQAVLQENFVFSFKNTLEVCAYNELDSQYARWSWNLRSKMLEWENTTELIINNFDTESTELKLKVKQKITEIRAESDEQKIEIKGNIIEEEIKRIAEVCLIKAKNIVYQTLIKTLLEMKLFLNSANYSDILSQFKHKTERKIKVLHDDNEKKAEFYCEQLIKNKLNHVEVYHQEVVNLVKMNSHITTLVDKSWKEDRQYSDRELEKMFEDTWKQWMVDFEMKTAKIVIKYPSPAEIDNEIAGILRELMEPNDPLIISRLSKEPFDKRSKNCSLELKVDKEIHLIINPKKWFTSFRGNGNSAVQLAEEFTKECLSKAYEYLDKIKHERKLFNTTFVQKVLRDLFTSLNDFMEPEKESKLFKFTAEYKVDMALVVCAYASAVFKEITWKIEKDNNPVAKLNKMKNDFMTKFKNKYKEVSEEKQAAIDLCALLRASIRESVEASLENKIVDKLRLKSHLSCKRNFNRQILEDLMMIGDSSLYRTYVYDIPGCYRYWIKHYIDDYVSNTPTVIVSLAQQQLLSIIKKIIDAIDTTCMKVEVTKLESWLSVFTENLQGTLPLPKNKVNAFVGSCEVKLFSKYINKEFDEIKLNLEARFNDARSIIDAMNNRSNSPLNLLYDKLIGCLATCPFCNEKCDNDVNHLGDHSMALHRPVCLGRYSNKDTKKCFNTCTEAINSTDTFECSETGYKQVKYSEYKTYFPNWYIPKLACGDIKYWKWFVCEYKEDVIRWAEASYTDIPSHWFHITQKEAKDSLRSI